MGWRLRHFKYWLYEDSSPKSLYCKHKATVRYRTWSTPIVFLYAYTLERYLYLDNRSNLLFNPDCLYVSQFRKRMTEQPCGLLEGLIDLWSQVQFFFFWISNLRTFCPKRQGHCGETMWFLWITFEEVKSVLSLWLGIAGVKEQIRRNKILKAKYHMN